MADINYTVNQDFPENIEGFEQYSQEDKNLLNSFQINSTFNPEKNYSELHILSLSDELLESDYLYNRHRQLGNAQSAGQDGASVLTIDPIADSKYYGYEGAGIKLLYHFLDDLYTDDISTREFFIQDISPDRTEVVLNSLNITQEQVISYTANIKNRLDTQSYFAGFRLNFKENDLIIATNIDTIDSGTDKLVAVKLYEPLPDAYDLKSTLTVVEILSDSIAYEVDSEYVIQPEQAPTLRPANFNIEIADESVVPTQYLNYNELFSYPVSNANSQVYSLISEKGIDINVDYTDFSNFVHFSSAQERLINFKYKLELIDSYYNKIIRGSRAQIGLTAVVGSKTQYEDLITGVINNFDHYERFLYYESGSSSWPKSNNTKPYTNQVGTTEANSWYSTQATTAALYDESNSNSLLYSIPAYLRDDTDNENYLTFVYMIGQHFDNLWLYSKAVTDKYNADNRPDRGISKDLVAEALKNFGIKLYTSNKSIQDLFTTFTGQAYQSGSEVINYYITGSLTGSNTPIQPTSYDNYQKEIQKRIYHNLPFLLKTKGTERGLRALINCFGIPSDILKIKQYGGINAATLPFLGDQQYFTNSLDKIRLDNAGTIVQGNTLSNSVSILKNNSEYTTDLHAIEVGFSPSDNIDGYIRAVNSGTCTKYTMVVETATTDTFTYIDCITGQLIQQVCDITRTFFAVTDTVNFNQNAGANYYLSPENLVNTIPDIDQYLGDSNNLYLDNYLRLYTDAEAVLGELDKYNLQDYVRLIKFFDNTIFKMIKDFIPARSVATTGIVIKPNLLNISKAKSVAVSATQPEYSGSIDTAFVSGSNGGIYAQSTGQTSTSYVGIIQTPQGLVYKYDHAEEESTFNGELSGSYIGVSSRDLNKDNLLKYSTLKAENQTVSFYENKPAFTCALSSPSPLPIPITVKGKPRDVQNDLVDQFFSGVAYISSSYIPVNSLGEYIFPDTNYKLYSVTASRAAIAACSSSASYLTQYCDLATTEDLPPSIITQSAAVNLTTWFTSGSNISASFTASWIDGTPRSQSIATPTSYTFAQKAGTIVNITYKDPLITAYSCQQSANITIDPIPTQNIVISKQYRWDKNYDGSTPTYRSFVSSSTSYTWTQATTTNIGGYYSRSSNYNSFTIKVVREPISITLVYKLIGTPVGIFNKSRCYFEAKDDNDNLSTQVSTDNHTGTSQTKILQPRSSSYYYSFIIDDYDTSDAPIGNNFEATFFFNTIGT